LFAEHRNLPKRRRIGAMHATYRQQQELKKQAAKAFAAINNWRYTGKNQALGSLVSPQNA
jgi:hypothetical protein